ncbi:carbon starvation protein CstA [Geobacter metallireducens RCH3]|uniref:Carbon starvation protein CstA n=1 Tax=Geobacter metallireducens (strain ATCC 53774 / DSM 7210 / GS-15) TaxID=269799 RepID=Q39S60_GEOMG|nr:carbon starvation protein A [Geobacter metallireducens]ABB32914.1 carbon starvation protein CstA [Geobacter metallireducens GS-15]EHP88952.1 carbon starvation protein CstA [Geobacter metallireducens RCH3]
MNALTLIFVALCVFALAYRYYGLFLANRVLGLREDRATPATTMADGHDYVKTNKYVLFGHHFAAIAAAGPLLGPVLAAQFGFLPGALWIIVGAVLAGAVHDAIVLFASVRHRGKSLSRIAETEIGKAAGKVASVAILFILILTLAGLSIAVVNAMFNSPWGTYTVFCTIPIAMVMGVYMQKIRPGDVKGGSIIGVALLALAILTGPYVAANPELAAFFTFSKKQIALIIPIYGFFASVLPVWFLLVPRDYLSTYLKIGTIALLALGIVAVHPQLQMPAITSYVSGGGPVIPGAVFPFIFVTIACGALSGFHAIIGSGTTPKMIANERDILFVGYGAMLTEGFVAIMALIAACVLVPADYFAINAAPKAFQALNMAPVNLPALSQAVGEQVQGRPGGAVSLAVGMAYIFSSIPVMKSMMAYWYHFAIMFEAVFILTAVDAGTRVGRYLLQEMLGKLYPRFADNTWTPGVIVTSILFTSAWGYLVYTGDITTIWPLFGMSNQLLATCALIVGTTMLIRLGKARYAWVTAVPGIFMIPVTMTAGYLNITKNFLPKGLTLLVVLSVVLMVLMAIVFIEAFRKWYALLQIREKVLDANGDLVLVPVESPAERYEPLPLQE